jgi:hypothetical protein
LLALLRVIRLIPRENLLGEETKLLRATRRAPVLFRSIQAI